MNKFKVGDVVVATGPLSIRGRTGGVHLIPGEVCSVVPTISELAGLTKVCGRESEMEQYIDSTSLTPFSEIAEDPEIDWGQVHDYVWDGTE